MASTNTHFNKRLGFTQPRTKEVVFATPKIASVCLFFLPLGFPLPAKKGGSSKHHAPITLKMVKVQWLLPLVTIFRGSKVACRGLCSISTCGDFFRPKKRYHQQDNVGFAVCSSILPSCSTLHQHRPQIAPQNSTCTSTPNCTPYHPTVNLAKLHPQQKCARTVTSTSNKTPKSTPKLHALTLPSILHKMWPHRHKHHKQDPNQHTLTASAPAPQLHALQHPAVNLANHLPRFWLLLEINLHLQVECDNYLEPQVATLSQPLCPLVAHTLAKAAGK